MRMRTCNIYLVQIAAVLIALGIGPSGHAGVHDYGADRQAGETHVRRTITPRARDNSRPGSATPQTQTDKSPRPAIDTPSRGLTMDRVLARYGAPLRRHAAVGQPPITRWDYANYRLYFEYDRVVHAVAPQAPEPVVHSNRLAPDNP